MPNDSILSSFALWLSWKATWMLGREEKKDDMFGPGKETQREHIGIYISSPWSLETQITSTKKPTEREGRLRGAIRSVTVLMSALYQPVCHPALCNDWFHKS